MPIFDYTCNDCGTDFEKLVPNADFKPWCPKCESKDVNKRVSGFSVGMIANGCATQKECTSGHTCGGSCSH